MQINTTCFQQLLSQFKLPQLFNELGWDQPTLGHQAISVAGAAFTLTPIAHKRGVAVLRCSPDANGRIPPRPVLLKIEHEARKIAHEHLLVFADVGETMLTWLWVLRAPGQPTSTRTHTWHQGQSGEALRQKLSQIVWSLEEEEAVTLTDVVTGLRRAFDRDRISKSFYDKFKIQHDTFAAYIIDPNQTIDRAWYASLMLNRLMFVYFIQKKGFLNGDENYLQNRMAQVQQAQGKGQFHSFYRRFLRRLFHEGLGQPQPRNAALGQLIGDNIPYLNGGLFDVHELEAANHDIDVPDEAFAQLFAFFDAWDWHLDDRPLASGKEINPDVLGYIFEKYINQKQMGAYYTKEDITEYISKNTVIPHLLEQARERCKVDFEGKSSVWKLLQSDPSRYLYPAIKTEGALPTETPLELADRRQRCKDLLGKLSSGEVKATDDLITLNLDIRQFMQDVIDNAASPQLLRAIWQAIVGRVPEKSNEKFRNGITILDPTCGSGAFLFAALGVLEPLYEACLDRMDSFVEDAKKLGKSAEADFEKVLAEVGKHPSRRYYIYKSIILHNLFGVDVMAEAVEICKLRLFLKLVSQVDKGQQLEPLPDIDFNIRAGNTLVGYATEAQFDASGDLASDQQRKTNIKADIADLADLFGRFREQQTVRGGNVTAQDKRALRDQLQRLSLELDRDLAHDYGVNPDNASAFAAWRASHQPFHWFAEFYGVMRDGGFDVVIGNPPYVAKRKVTGYTVKGYATVDCTDIYAWCLERVIAIVHPKSHTGMIVPLSLSFSGDFDVLRKLLYARYCGNWFSHFAKRPSMLFTGVQVRNTIHIGKLGNTNSKHLTSRIHRWPNEARSHLFATLSYAAFQPRLWKDRIPKLNTQGLIDAFEKLLTPGGRTVTTLLSRSVTTHMLRFKKTAYNWLSFTHKEAPCFDSSGKRIPQNEYGEISFLSVEGCDVAFLLLNGKMQLAFWVAVGDDFHVTKGNFSDFPLVSDCLTPDVQSKLKAIVAELRKALDDAIVYMPQFGKQIGNYNLAKCRRVTDKSDAIFAEAFGFAPVWDDIELLYVQTVKTNFETSADDEE